MLSEELKDAIRDAYNAIIERKSLTARWGQRQMIAEIANALARIPESGEPEEPPVCVIEAGTGTGKTIAFLLATLQRLITRDDVYVCRRFRTSTIRQVFEKRRADEARSLQGSWFPSVMERVVTMAKGKEDGKIPHCVTKLAAALHKVREKRCPQ